MDIKQFIEVLREQFDDEDIDEITPDTRFKDLDEWSSIVALSIIAAIDEEFDITLKGEDINKSNTVSDLYEIIKARM